MRESMCLCVYSPTTRCYVITHTRTVHKVADAAASDTIDEESANLDAEEASGRLREALGMGEDRWEAEVVAPLVGTKWTVGRFCVCARVCVMVCV